jgi:hypothetical protein
MRARRRGHPNGPEDPRLIGGAACAGCVGLLDDVCRIGCAVLPYPLTVDVQPSRFPLSRYPHNHHHNHHPEPLGLVADVQRIGGGMTEQPSRRRVPTLTEPGSVGRWMMTAGRWAQPMRGGGLTALAVGV